jgi:hypothetical protein
MEFRVTVASPSMISSRIALWFDTSLPQSGPRGINYSPPPPPILETVRTSGALYFDSVRRVILTTRVRGPGVVRGRLLCCLGLFLSASPLFRHRAIRVMALVLEKRVVRFLVDPKGDLSRPDDVSGTNIICAQSKCATSVRPRSRSPVRRPADDNFLFPFPMSRIVDADLLCSVLRPRRGTSTQQSGAGGPVFRRGRPSPDWM